MRRALLSVLILAALLFTLHSLRLSDASFTAASHSAANVFVAGSLGHVNDQNGKVMLSAGGLTPGHSSSGTMTLTGTGDVAGTYMLEAADLVDVPDSPALSDTLMLKIEDTTGTPTTLWGPDFVAAFDWTSLGSIAPHEVRKYRVTLSYPNGPVDSDLQGAVMTLVLEVDGVSE